MPTSRVTRPLRLPVPGHRDQQCQAAAGEDHVARRERETLGQKHPEDADECQGLSERHRVEVEADEPDLLVLVLEGHQGHVEVRQHRRYDVGDHEEPDGRLCDPRISEQVDEDEEHRPDLDVGEEVTEDRTRWKGSGKTVKTSPSTATAAKKTMKSLVVDMPSTAPAADRLRADSSQCSAVTPSRIMPSTRDALSFWRVKAKVKRSNTVDSTKRYARSRIPTGTEIWPGRTVLNGRCACSRTRAPPAAPSRQGCWCPVVELMVKPLGPLSRSVPGRSGRGYLPPRPLAAHPRRQQQRHRPRRRRRCSPP